MDSNLFKRAHVQEHIWSAPIWANKSKAPIGIPPYRRADGHDVRDRPLCETLHATTFPRGGELSNQQFRTSPSAHLQLLGPGFSQDHLQPSRPRMNSVFVRLIRLPIARTLRPVSANLRSLASSACVHGRESKWAGSLIGPCPEGQSKPSSLVALITSFRKATGERAKVVCQGLASQ